MKFIKTYEKYGIENPKRIKKHVNQGGGALDIFRRMADTYYNIGKKEFNTGLSVYKDILIELKRIFKKKVDVDTIKYLNNGSYGMAFDAGDKVIKITTDATEAEIAEKLIKKKYKNCVRYYEVVHIPTYDIYAILMDKAETLNKKEIAIIDLLREYDGHFEYDKSTKSYHPMGEYLSMKNLLSKLKGYKVTKIELQKYINAYFEMIDSLAEQKIPSDDAIH